MSNSLQLVPLSSPANISVVKKARRKKTNSSSVKPSDTALRYNGPTRLPQSVQQNDTVTTQINVAATISSSGSGVIDTVFDSVSQVTSSSDWASWAALYIEFRVLSMDLELYPTNKYNLPTTTGAAALFSVVDRNAAAALASLTSAVNYDSVEGHEPSTKVRRVVKMNSPEEADWIDTGSTPGAASRMYIKLWSSGNSNSTSFYTYLNRILVQFRGRK